MKLTRKGLEQWVGKERGDLAWALMKNRQFPPDEDIPRTRAWERQCYNAPDHEELTAKALDEILEMCGVEAIFDKEGRVILEYLNSGDMYTETLYRTVDSSWTRRATYGDWRLGCLGDWLESPAGRKAR